LEFALKAHVSPSAVTRWESGKLPPVRELMRIADLLDRHLPNQKATKGRLLTGAILAEVAAVLALATVVALVLRDST
jgi:transcriptional regulator with XRE-family HTH domain